MSRTGSTARLPRELAPELGKLGLLGIHLTGYGCAGMGAIAYGVACRELEAADSGLRSLVHVHPGLAVCSRSGSTARTSRRGVAAADAAWRVSELFRADRGRSRHNDPGSMATTAKPNGTGWVLNGTKMWITNGSVADIAVVWARTPDGIRGFLVPKSARRLHRTELSRKLCAARLHLCPGTALRRRQAAPPRRCCPGCPGSRARCPA